MPNPINLTFSEPIELADNQYSAIVIDGLEGAAGHPLIGNYGLIKVGEAPNPVEGENDIPYYRLEARISELENNTSLLYPTVEGEDPEEIANKKLPPERDYDVLKTEVSATSCANEYYDITNFTIKTFPNYGPYGFVNYNLGDDSTIHFGITLDKVRNGGDIFK